MKKYIPLSIEDYQKICSVLSIGPETDALVSEYLSKHLQWLKVRISTKVLKRRLENKIALIFGAGPSLPKMISEYSTFIKSNREKLAIIAADGALKALLENNIFVDVVVTDLDGSLMALRDCLKLNSNIVIHAHGDNLTKLQEANDLLSKLGVIGSTQGVANCKVKNFGGFTDGDRAAYLAANFKVKTIILLAFDFGTIVGKYSKPEQHKDDFKAPERKLEKFSIAKELLAKLPKYFPTISFYNASSKGEIIENWTIIEKETLLEII